MWESGEADLVIGDPATGDIEANEHMELTTRLGARGLLEDMARAVAPDPPAARYRVQKLSLG